jgi:hypothetical protein
MGQGSRIKPDLGHPEEEFFRDAQKRTGKRFSTAFTRKLRPNAAGTLLITAFST